MKKVSLIIILTIGMLFFNSCEDENDTKELVVYQYLNQNTKELVLPYSIELSNIYDDKYVVEFTTIIDSNCYRVTRGYITIINDSITEGFLEINYLEQRRVRK